MNRKLGTYKAFQVRWSSLEGQNDARVLIASSSALQSVIRSAKIYIAREWKGRENVVTIPRVNGKRRWDVPAAYLKAYRRRVIASTPTHMVEVVYFPE